MATISWTQDNEFNLEPISENGGTITGYYKLQASGKWFFSVSVTGRSPMLVFSSSGTVDTQAIANAVATAVVNGAVGALQALPPIAS